MEEFQMGPSWLKYLRSAGGNVGFHRPGNEAQLSLFIRREMRVFLVIIGDSSQRRAVYKRLAQWATEAGALKRALRDA